MGNSLPPLPEPHTAVSPAHRMMGLAIRTSIYLASGVLFLRQAATEKLLALIYLPLGCFWLLLTIEKGIQLKRRLNSGNQGSN